MVRLEGDKSFTQTPQELWPKLTDMRFLVQCLPDVDEVRDVQEKSACLVIRPGLAFVRGELQLIIEKTEETPPTSAKLVLKTKGIGTNSEVEACFSLAEQPGNGTHVHYVAETKQLGGLLKAVPEGFIQGAAQQVINDILNNLEQKMKQ
jgi:carbon monoxide dehydrogenase subunit G